MILLRSVFHRRRLYRLGSLASLIASFAMFAVDASGKDPVSRGLTREQASQPTTRMIWRPVQKSKHDTDRLAESTDASHVVHSDSAAGVGGIVQASMDLAEPLTFNEPFDSEFAEQDSAFDHAGCCDTCGEAECSNGCSRNSCGGPFELWVRAEYLLWSLDGANLPALVTTSPTGTAPQNIGALGSNSSVLFGGQSVGDDARSGGRVTIGGWLDRSGRHGIEASYLGIERDGDGFNATSSAFPNLARPVFDTGTNAEVAMIVAAAGTITGSVAATFDNRLQVFEVLGRQQLSGSRCDRLDWLLGYRHGRLDERLRIDQSSTFSVPQGQIIAGTTKSLFDLFEAENRFNGAEFGLNYQRFQGPWTLATIAKLGVGVNRADVLIDGATLTTVPGGGSAPFVGGLLAQQSNIGRYSQSDFAVLPEVGVTLVGNLSRSTQVSVGYSLLYWSVVARASDQVDRNVSQFPPEPVSGTGNPQFNFETDGFIAHGLQAGLLHQF